LSGYKIEKIEIEGFRGFNSKQVFSFKSPLTLLVGRNGVGKSSTLMAIEWCLFGDVAYLLHLEGRAKDEVVNQFSDDEVARVAMELSNGNQTYSISRSKKMGNSKSEFKIQGPALHVEDELAEQHLFKLFGVTLDDFIRSTYLHQESIKGLLVEDASTRDEALDRLFGLERIRNIVQSIPIKKVRDNIDDLEQKKGSLERKIEGAVEQIQNDLEKLRTKASDLGVYKDQQTLGFSLSTAESVAQRMKDIASNYDLPLPAFEAPSELSQIESFERKVKTALREMETRIIGTSKITELNSEKSNLQDYRTRVLKSKRELAENDDSINQIIGKYGKGDDLIQRISAISEHVLETDRRRNLIDIESRLIEDATVVLHAGTYPNCPVCGQRIDSKKVLANLEGKTSTQTKADLSSLEDEKKRLQSEEEELERASKNFRELLVAKQKILELQKRLVEEGQSIPGQNPRTVDEILTTTDARLEQIGKDIDEFNDAYRKRAVAFDGVRQDLEQISAVGDALKKEGDFKEVSSHFKSESEEIKQLASAISELRIMGEQLSIIVRAAAEVQVGLAAQIIKESESEIQSFYSRLCKHQAYSELRINVKSRELRGLVKNSYSIKAYNKDLGKETFVSTRFSAGQMNSVALAVCFALSTILRLQFGFLILDDPAQTLDSDHKTSLATLLLELAKQKQIIVATQDEELQDLLAKSSEVEIVSFPSWNVRGPVAIQQIAQIKS
jgi:exonuclease SbcC